LELLTRVSLGDLASASPFCTNAISGYFVQSMTRSRFRADFLAGLFAVRARERHGRGTGGAPRACVLCVPLRLCRTATRQWHARAVPHDNGGASVVVGRGVQDRALIRAVVHDRLRCARSSTCGSSSGAGPRTCRCACTRSAPPRHPPCVHTGRCTGSGVLDRRTGLQDVFAFDHKNETWQVIRLPPRRLGSLDTKDDRGRGGQAAPALDQYHGGRRRACD
jgi:hypothetical protein